MRFFCPRCWRDFERDVLICPYCGLDIQEFWRSRDYVGKLIIALNHPEKETPIRAAWLLGQLKDKQAVSPLIDLIKKTEDVYIAREAVQALGEIATPEARRAGSCHPSLDQPLPLTDPAMEGRRPLTRCYAWPAMA
jgi:RNA polymerase subunit RPABC4/transcription elongation factor Spt4